MKIMTVAECFKNLYLGFFIGIAMLIPGVSGGTIAVLLGIYDTLLSAVSHFFKNIKYNLLLLGSMAIGGLLGFGIAARLIAGLLTFAYQETLYFFIGTILGGIITLYMNKSGETKKVNIPMLIFGMIVVMLIECLPNDILNYSGSSLLIQFIILLAVGILLAVALILPGVSFSMMLVIAGIYKEFIVAVKTFDFRFLMPLMFAVLFGVIVCAKLLSKFMEERPNLCESMILGFILASIGEMYPGFPMGVKLVWCVMLMATGFCFSWLASVLCRK